MDQLSVIHDNEGEREIMEVHFMSKKFVPLSSVLQSAVLIS
jgi:hypothetical protein